MNKNNNKMDLLGNAPVPQALMALGIPIMIGMLINALYNLVDAYFIGGLGESQMGAISIAFPLGQVVVGLGLMFGNGAASYLSRLLGRGDTLHPGVDLAVMSETKGEALPLPQHTERYRQIFSRQNAVLITSVFP